MALVCRQWRALERQTRRSLALRGQARSPWLIPTCFPNVAHLDLSLLSPWGHAHPFLAAPRPLALAFPNVASLTVYARDPSALRALAPLWPRLRRAKLVRWHRRPDHPPGSDLAPLHAACPALDALDLSEFYCWTDDVAPALLAHPAAAAALTRLDLLLASASDGFRASELSALSSACPNLRHLRAPCVFNPRFLDFVGDAALLALAAGCPRLSLLHLLDPSARDADHAAGPGADADDSRITPAGLEALFAALPGLEDLALDLRHSVRGAGPALEALARRCPRIRALRLGRFHGICNAAWLHLDGVAVCGALQSLCVHDCPDLTDSALAAVARGCRRLSSFEIRGCPLVTEVGLRKLAAALRTTLREVRISSCALLDAPKSLRALDPLRDRIERLHIDCVWPDPDEPSSPPPPLQHLAPDEDAAAEAANGSSDVDEFDPEVHLSACRKKRRCNEEECGDQLGFEFDHVANGGVDYTYYNYPWYQEWEQLRYLSLWLPAGEVLTPLANAGLGSCPELEEICIKIEGDCRSCVRPADQGFGLSSLVRYPKLSKMKLDCGEAIGYALTAPSGQMDLSLWERFYLHGIGGLNLYELDYWPPQDRDVNQRSLSLPATGLIQGCTTLRKLFIHGTTHEHFMRFFLLMPNLRDVQLREDYYPAPENDMSTEMRVDSCSRFEEALNSRRVPD